MKQLMVRAHLGSAVVQVGVEIDGYSPDLLDDVSTRVTAMMKAMAMIAEEHGIPIDEPASGMWRIG